MSGLVTGNVGCAPLPSGCAPRSVRSPFYDPLPALAVAFCSCFAIPIESGSLSPMTQADSYLAPGLLTSLGGESSHR